MILTIKRMVIDHFKGAEHLELDFRGKSARVKGVNGSFKTTCAEAWLWLFADCNYALVKNPSITPLGMSECVSRVEADIEIDEKPCQVAKVQKFKSKTDDNGKVTSSVVNTYEINSVSKSYRDFVSDLESRGLDLNNFLILSHPFAFTIDTSKAGREKMRALLFSMTDSLSDSDIASELSNSNELNALLENYRVDEIEQMQKATLRKVNETCGKDNSIINAKIDGLISSKVQGNVAELTKELNKVNSEIEKAEKKSSDNGIETEINDVERKLRGIEFEENEKLESQKRQIRNQISDVDMDIEVATARYNTVAYEISNINAQIGSLNKSTENWRGLYKKVQDEVLDDESCKCPTCNRVYAKSKVDKIKSDFEKSKTERLTMYKNNAEKALNEISELEKTKETKANDLDEAKKIISVCKKKKEKLNTELDKLPADVNYSKNKEWVSLNKKLSQLETEAASKQPDDNSIELIFDLKAKANELTKKIGAIEHNADIDAKVESLREDRKQGEINKANAEKILDQVERFKKLKNERLTDSINSHFKIISFKLFDHRKNGEYIDTVEILIDGKPINTCANGSLITLAQISCIDGLQSFFNQHLPVWVDDAALMTKETSSRVELNSQLIWLVATEGVDKLEVEYA